MSQIFERIRVDYDDDDVKTRVSSFLSSRHFSMFRGLDVDVRHGAVTVSGSLKSFYEKQVALNTCRRVAGVLTLIDRIEVDAADSAAIETAKTPDRSFAEVCVG